MVIFDLDLYEPTKLAIKEVLPRLTKGSVLVFDELTLKYQPGEAMAVMETLGFPNLKLRRFPHQSWTAYAVWQ